MRPDVKLGVVISMVIVLIAGTYYMYRDTAQTPIQLAGGRQTADHPAAADRQTSTPLELPRAQPPRPAPDADAAGASSRRSDGPLTPAAGSGEPAPTVSRDRVSQGKSTVTSPGGTNLPENRGRAAGGLSGHPSSGRGERHLADGGKTKTQTPSRSDALARLDRSRPETGGGAERTAAARSMALAAPRTVRTGTPTRPQADSRAVAVETHRIQSGDTISSLAQRYYGSAKFASFLIVSNKQISDPNRLRIGAIIRIPPRPAAAAVRTPSSSDVAPTRQKTGGARTYRVQPGDSFYAIARDVLGDATRWKELLELNSQLVNGEPTSLKAGQVLVLPTP